MHPSVFRGSVIDPVLLAMGAYSPQASNLLLGTAMAESGLDHLRQMGGGPALGFFQMEPATHADIWQNFLAYRDRLRITISQFLAPSPQPVAQLISNLAYATAMCRVHYMRVPDPIPDDLDGQAAYWKRHYNTVAGAGTPEHYRAGWKLTFRGEGMVPPTPAPFPD